MWDLYQKYSRAIAIITLTYIATGWTGWFWETFWTQPTISWVLCIREWGWEEGEEGGGEGRWVNNTSRHSQPSCVHSGPDRWPQQPWPYHESCRHAMEQNWMLSYPINAPQGPHRVYYGPLWLDKVDNKPSVKADLLIYTSFVIVSGQCMSVAITISNQMDFNSCMYMEGFCKSSHIRICTYEEWGVYWTAMHDSLVLLCNYVLIDLILVHVHKNIKNALKSLNTYVCKYICLTN